MSKLLSIVSKGDVLCLLFEDKAVRIDVQAGTLATQEVAPNALAIVFAGQSPMICYSGNAAVLDFAADGE